jgi:DNA modification methylase
MPGRSAARKVTTSQGQKNRLVVAYCAIEQLRLDAKNPRLHSPRQVRKIANSIEAFGFNVPVLVDAGLNVIAGHGRVLACQLLDRKEAPIIRLEHLNEAQARAFMIADNRLTEVSEWDEQLLAEQLLGLAGLDLEFSLEVTGFEMAEIDLRIEGLAVTNAEPDPADAVPANSGPSVSCVGDLWSLGHHRILCDNSLEASSYARLLEGEQAAVVFTDPPYNVPIEGHASGLGAVTHRDFAMASGEMDKMQFTAFLTKVCSLLAKHSRDGSIHYLCMDWRHMEELLRAGHDVYGELKNMCVWVKSNAGMGSFYRSQHELIFVFKHGRNPHRNNVQLGKFGRHRSNVWSYPVISSFGRGSDEGNLLNLHPTVKPVALVADAIMDCSARGDVVLDAFLGSGTTVIAADRTGRRGYGIELDPAYVDTAIRRWQIFSRDSARHVLTGERFDEIAIKRN